MTLALPCRPGAALCWTACARISAPQIDECSGLVKSRRYPGAFWVHNDSGDRARFFAIDSRGDLLAEVELEGARNVDWEDIATDADGRLYLGDFGNNRNSRRDLVIYVVDEPDPRGRPAAPLRVPVRRRLPFHYPDQGAFPDSGHLDFDCEAMFCDSGRVYLLTKHRSDIRTTLYRLDPEREGEQEAARLGGADIGSPVTAADMSPDGQTLAVLSYQYIHLFERPAAGEDFLAGRSHATLIEGRQCEALCLDGDRVLFANEQREIFCVSLRYLWTHDRYLPEPPRVAAPWVAPRLDGLADEWPRRRSAGRLAFDRFLDEAAAARTRRRAQRAALLDSVKVRVGWCPQGVLLHARWPLAAAARTGADSVVLHAMLGRPGSGRPCLEAGQEIWEAVLVGDTLSLRSGAPEVGQPRCAAPDAAGPPRTKTRWLADGTVAFEALLPVPGPRPLTAGDELLLDVVLLAPRRAASAEVAWSATLDMQPLGNPLLWGRVRLEGTGR